MNGSIAVESKEREGTEFSVKFPVTIEKIEIEPKDNPTSIEFGHIMEKISGSHVLIAEEGTSYPVGLSDIIKSLD